jgi:hypothetical protein
MKMPDSIEAQNIERAARQRWATTPALHQEFPNEACYLAFVKADAQGLVKIQGRRKGTASEQARG